MKNPKPANKFKICSRSLGLTLTLMLASGIQLEATAGRLTWSVWAHIVLGFVLIVLALWHVFLYYRVSNWFYRFAKNKNTITRVLWWVFLLTAVSGIVATVMWVGARSHSRLGAVHGKIGFLMVLLGIIHFIRHKRKRG